MPQHLYKGHDGQGIGTLHPRPKLLRRLQFAVRAHAGGTQGLFWAAAAIRQQLPNIEALCSRMRIPGEARQMEIPRNIYNYILCVTLGVLRGSRQTVADLEPIIVTSLKL
eukprot:6214550-Pleurochrysis_carterae.AAC.1